MGGEKRTSGRNGLCANPVDTGQKLNVHKTFRRRPGRLVNVLCTFNLRPVSTGDINTRVTFLFFFIFDSCCVKSVQIRSLLWSVFSCIRTRNDSVLGHF